MDPSEGHSEGELIIKVRKQKDSEEKLSCNYTSRVPHKQLVEKTESKKLITLANIFIPEDSIKNRRPLLKYIHMFIRFLIFAYMVVKPKF